MIWGGLTGEIDEKADWEQARNHERADQESTRAALYKADGEQKTGQSGKEA